MKRNNVLSTNTNTPTSTTFSSKAAKVHIRKSLSSPTNGPVVLLPSEFPKKESIPIPASSNKNKKGKPNHQIRLNTSPKSDNNHHLSSSSTTTSTTTTSTHERPHLRMSASSRFGKNLLPTWLGGHSTEDGSHSPTTPNSPVTSVNSPTADDIDSVELANTFERLLVKYSYKKI